MKDEEKTIGKGLELLELIGRSRDGLRGKEIAGALELPVSTAYRQLKFLADRGFLNNDGNGVYTQGSALVRLGCAAMRQNPLARRAHPLLAALSDPVLCWFGAYFVPGRLTGGFDTRIRNL